MEGSAYICSTMGDGPGRNIVFSIPPAAAIQLLGANAAAVEQAEHVALMLEQNQQNYDSSFDEDPGNAQMEYVLEHVGSQNVILVIRRWGTSRCSSRSTRAR